MGHIFSIYGRGELYIRIKIQRGEVIPHIIHGIIPRDHIYQDIICVGMIRGIKSCGTDEGLILVEILGVTGDHSGVGVSSTTTVPEL